MSVPDVVLCERLDDGVALLTLNRPDRHNAWTAPMALRYFDLLDELATAAEVRAVVLTGAGRGFCPGADFELLEQASAAGGLDESSFDEALRGRLPVHPAWFPKPLIAAVNGACAGVGLAQALLADLRFAADGVKLTTAFARRGLIAEYGLSWLLPRVVGASAARDLLLSARVVDAAEALRLGLVDRVLPAERLVAEAVAYARDVAVHCSPASIATMKRQLLADEVSDLDTATRRAEELRVRSLAGPDFVEGVASYLEKRRPAFPPLGQGTRL
jgi:enoyl-CoA hydratase/carnithine racemase